MATNDDQMPRGLFGAVVVLSVFSAAVSVLVGGIGGLQGYMDGLLSGFHRDRARPTSPLAARSDGRNRPADGYAEPVSSPGQLVRFAELNGRRVAWAAVGDGPPMVMGGWWMSHLELDWGNRRFRDFISALARYRTVVRYDRPGTGLSDRDGPPPVTLDDEVAVLAGVVDAVGAESVVVFAGSAGGPIAARYAADHPRQVERLVLYGSYLNGAAIADPAARETLVTLIRRH